MAPYLRSTVVGRNRPKISLRRPLEGVRSLVLLQQTGEPRPCGRPDARFHSTAARYFDSCSSFK